MKDEPVVHSSHLSHFVISTLLNVVRDCLFSFKLTSVTVKWLKYSGNKIKTIFYGSP